jgi:precorrin-6B methylase 2
MGVTVGDGVKSSKSSLFDWATPPTEAAIIIIITIIITRIQQTRQRAVDLGLGSAPVEVELAVRAGADAVAVAVAVPPMWVAKAQGAAFPVATTTPVVVSVSTTIVT